MIKIKVEFIDEKFLLNWIKSYVLNSENNIELREIGKFLFYEIKRKMWDCMLIF